MADVSAVASDGHKGSGLRRAATRLLGDQGAHELARKMTLARVAGRSTLTRDGRETSRRLAEFRDRHVGERCVIIGNGPSLNQTPMALLENEFTFGLNRIYLMFEELGFRTTYHVVVNKYVVEQCVEDFESLRSPLFTTRHNRDYLSEGSSRYFLDTVNGPHFGRDLTRGVWEGATVTYVAMQVAYYMGFSKVILVGVDHSFASKGDPHKLVESQADDANHFNPAYFGKGFKWQLPDLETSELAYALARNTFEADGRSIVDATVGGKLEVFPKVELRAELAR